MAKRLKKLVIEESNWLRYGSNAFVETMLRNPKTGGMCCLGFLGLSCGASPRLLNRKFLPEALAKKVEWPKGVLEEEGNDTLWTLRATQLNDSRCVRKGFKAT